MSEEKELPKVSAEKVAVKKVGLDEGNENKQDGGNEFVEIPVGKYFSRLKGNPWILATFLFVVLFVVSLFWGGLGNRITGNVINENDVGQNIIDFVKAQTGESAEISSVNKKDSFYEVIVKFQGKEIPLYTTLDGKYLTSNFVSLVEIQEEQVPAGSQGTGAPAEVPKSDKPVVQLFVMSHCPYGTQIEKGIIPVVELLKDKIDFKLEFVNYAIHGEKEVNEEVKQYCIQEEQGDKFLDYLTCFLEDGNSDRCIEEIKINADILNGCVKATNEKFRIKENLENPEGQFPKFLIYDAENQQYGVQGSPTLVINGKQVSSARDSASLLKTICSAFNELPGECNEELSSASPSPGFGFGETSNTGSTATCG